MDGADIMSARLTHAASTASLRSKDDLPPKHARVLGKAGAGTADGKANPSFGDVVALLSPVIATIQPLFASLAERRGVSLGGPSASPTVSRR